MGGGRAEWPSVKRFDVRSLRFDERNEAWRRFPVEVEPFVLGGAPYDVRGGQVDLSLSAGRVGERLTLTVSFSATLRGPCDRCLETAEIPVEVRAVEVARRGESEGADPAEAYVRGSILDIHAWVRDLIASALPERMLCSEGCRGLCPICGANLNTEPEHTHEVTGS